MEGVPDVSGLWEEVGCKCYGQWWGPEHDGWWWVPRVVLGLGVPDEMLGGLGIPSAVGGVGVLNMMGGLGVLRCISEHVPHAQDPLERERALQLQIAEASRRLCHEENIGRQVRKRRQTAALREEQKLRDLEQVLSQRRLLAGQQDTSTAKGEPPKSHR